MARGAEPDLEQTPTSTRAGSGVDLSTLGSLRRLLDARLVAVFTGPNSTAGLVETSVAADDVTATQVAAIRTSALAMIARDPLTDHEFLDEPSGWTVWVGPVWTASSEPVGALVAAVDGPMTPEAITAVRAHGALTGLAVARDAAEIQSHRHRTLDQLVTRVAVRVMSGSRESFDELLEWVLKTLVEFFGVDTAYYRRNDHDAGVSILVDEWPRRQDVPDPDPLGVVPFEGSDPVFAAIRDLRQPFVIRPISSPTDYLERVEEGSGIPQVSMAMVPLLSDHITEGVLGFVNFRDRAWEVEETNALQAIASLLTQLQGRIDAEERLHFSAFHDELTGLPNRRSLLAALDERLSVDANGAVAAVFVDIDQFKGMNDVLGHGAGDRVLIAIADRLRTVLRPSDVAARFGGDEFVVLLSGPVTSMEAYAVADRLLHIVARPVDLNGQAVNRTASLGIALGEPGTCTAEELLARSDAALYAAKARGRNQICLFDDDLRAEVDDRYNLEISLRSAIDDGGLRLFYQPEVNLRTGRLQGFEALVRWEHPVRGLLPAGAFITLAEDTGLIVDLGSWVLQEGCRQLAVWRAAHPELKFVLRMNVSPAQLLNRNLVETVVAALTRHGLAASSLCLEITESAVMQDVERSIAVLEELRALGVALAIDDFGTGQSSMAQLKHMPVTTLKIDRSFVQGVEERREDKTIVESIIRLAHSFALDVVAEGVETVGQAHALQKMGCLRAQGFLFSPALRPAECLLLLEREAQLASRTRVPLAAWMPAPALS
jgi:diguanylate cyclase (GGDEF)-like protein